MPTRDEAWVALEQGFKAFTDCLGQLTVEELTTPGVVGDWTVKDVVADVWSWVDEAAQTGRAWQGRRPWQEGVSYDDVWAQRQVDARAELPWFTVVDGLTGAHRQLMLLLDTADAAMLDVVGRTPTGEEITLLAYLMSIAERYRDHVAVLSEYQERCLAGCG